MYGPMPAAGPRTHTATSPPVAPRRSRLVLVRTVLLVVRPGIAVAHRGGPLTVVIPFAGRLAQACAADLVVHRAGGDSGFDVRRIVRVALKLVGPSSGWAR